MRQEKVELEETLEKEQEYQVNKLMRKIEKLERDTVNKQATLEQVIRLRKHSSRQGFFFQMQSTDIYFISPQKHTFWVLIGSVLLRHI